MNGIPGLNSINCGYENPGGNPLSGGLWHRHRSRYGRAEDPSAPLAWADRNPAFAASSVGPLTRKSSTSAKWTPARTASTSSYFTNRGDQPLTLNPGSTSCSCTVSEIKDSELAPGQSTKVLVSWRSKGRVGPFQQSVTVITSDPLRPEVTLTIKGEYTQAVYADPDELTFGQIAGNEPVTHETRIFCNLPNQQIKIQGHQTVGSQPGKVFSGRLRAPGGRRAS